MLTTRPQPSLVHARQHRAATSRNGASTITLRIVENTSGGNSSIGATCWNPALLTTMSTARSGSASTNAGSDRSATTGVPADLGGDLLRRLGVRSTTSTGPGRGQPVRAGAPDPAARPGHHGPPPR